MSESTFLSVGVFRRETFFGVFFEGVFLVGSVFVGDSTGQVPVRSDSWGTAGGGDVSALGVGSGSGGFSGRNSDGVCRSIFKCIGPRGAGTGAA